jgi:hypothetical protein
MKSELDRLHDESKEFLDDIAGFIAPLLPEGYKWTLYLSPGQHLEIWSGNMSPQEFLASIAVRADKEASKLGYSSLREYLESVSIKR